MNGFRSHIKNSKECFIRYPNTSKSVKKTRLRLVFSTHFSGFAYPDETLFLVFDILLLKLYSRENEIARGSDSTGVGRMRVVQPSTQAFSSCSHDLARNFVTSPNGIPVLRGPRSVTSRHFVSSRVD